MDLPVFVGPRTALGLSLWLVACGEPAARQHVDPAETADASEAEPDATSDPDDDDAGERPDSDDAGSAHDASASGPRDAGQAHDAGTARADAGRMRDAGSPTSPNDAATHDAAAADPKEVARVLDGFFMDVPCAPSTPTPLAQGATCAHATGIQRVEKKLTLGGEPGKVYTITLRIRGIWEPTLIQGGQRPDKAHPFTIGGMPPPGTNSSDPINYQQYSLEVSEPKQTYWFNDHQYVAHDIHKEDYQAVIRAAGGAQISVIMNDGNDHQIANFTKDYFAGLPPYDKAPSTGQSLHLDVVSVTSATP